MVGIREQGRVENTSRILASARQQVADGGAAALSMRAVARDVGMVSSAVFRYFPSREALLTQMIIESYEHLAGAIEVACEGQSGAPAWRRATYAARAWAKGFPHEFRLIYGTPIPGYQAPPQTIPAAARVAAPFLRIVAAHEVPRDDRAAEFMQDGGVAAPAVMAAVVAELAQLIGLLTLELAGHFSGVVLDADRFLDAVVERQIGTLGLA